MVWVEADSPDEASQRAREMWARGDLAEITAAKADDMTRALEFYANPESYFATFIMPDRPAGPFADDIGCVEMLGEHDHRHGRLARQALGREWWGTEPCEDMLKQIAEDE